MNQEQSENSITISALIVGGIFAYRKAVEPEVAKGASAGILNDYKSVFGAAPPIEWGQWLKASGLLYITLSIIGSASPEIGSAAAILVATTAIIGNGVAVMQDLNGKKSPVERLKETHGQAHGPTIEGNHITYPNLQSVLEGQPGSALANTKG